MCVRVRVHVYARARSCVYAKRIPNIPALKKFDKLRTGASNFSLEESGLHFSCADSEVSTSSGDKRLIRLRCTFTFILDKEGDFYGLLSESLNFLKILDTFEGLTIDVSFSGVN